MGHITKRSGHYRARWLDPDGRERSRTFSRKADAERHLTAVEGAKLSGAYIDHASKITLAEYAREWAATRPHRPTTAARTAYLISKHIAGTKIGDRRLSTLRASELQGWVAERSQILAPSTLRLVAGVLRSILSSAVQDRLIASSPATRLSLPRSERERVVPLSTVQVQALADAMPERCRAMVIAQAGLGLRIGELMALRVTDINFLARTARIDWQTSPDGKQRVAPKTPRSRRTLPLPNMVAEALAQHIAAFPPVDGLLFTTKHGHPWRHEYYGFRIFAPAVRKAGVPEGTTTHALRHHFASVLLAAGESVVAVAELLGHENAQLVLSTYGHLMVGSEDRMRRAIDGAWTADGQMTASGIYRMS